MKILRKGYSWTVLGLTVAWLLVGLGEIGKELEEYRQERKARK